MPIIASSFFRDANRVPIIMDGIIVPKTVNYVAATTGTIGAVTLFTVTGDVIATVFSVCSGTLTSAGTPTMEVGITGNTAALVAQVADATAIGNGEIFLDATPATVETFPSAKILTNGTDIIQTIASATVTAGTLTWYCLWRPLNSDGNVVAA